MFLIISTCDQFISHWIVVGSLWILWQYLYLIVNCFIEYQSWNDIGDSGITSLSSGLKVNSCVTSLGLEICIFEEWVAWSVFFISLAFTTILEIQEHVHWEKWWRIIQLWHHWIWEWFYETWEMMFCPLIVFERNGIGSSGVLSLRSGLEVNSTITSIGLEWCFCMMFIFRFEDICVW